MYSIRGSMGPLPYSAELCADSERKARLATREGSVGSGKFEVHIPLSGGAWELEQ
jgi:hypothetical protein